MENLRSQVTADFFLIKTDHDVSLILTHCCQCLNITIQTLIIVSMSGECIAILPILAENKCNILTCCWYVQHQHFCELLGTLKTTFPDYVHRNGNTLRIIFPSKHICCCNYEKVISFQNIYMTTTHCFETQHYSFLSTISVNNLFFKISNCNWFNIYRWNISTLFTLLPHVIMINW